MAQNYLPARESELVTWSTNFAQLITAGPTTYGLTDLQADAYNEARTSFATAYQTANDPTTRSPANIEAKDTARDALLALTRQLVKVVQAWPDMTDERRVALGITVPDLERTPVPAPDTWPQLDITSVVGWTVNVRLHDGDSTGRRRPAGVKGANVFSYVGETPPTEVGAWKFEGGTTRSETAVEFPHTLPPGTKVWLTAFWFNPTMQSGPACPPVSTQINYGGLARGGQPGGAGSA